MKGKKYILILLSVILICGVFYLSNVYRHDNNMDSESNTIIDVNASPSVSSDKLLNLKGNSSIIITIYPSVMEDKSYLMEVYDNGTIETTVGILNRKAFIEEFTGEKEDIFKEVIDTKKGTITDGEIEEINQMISQIDWEKEYKHYKEKEIGADADQKMIWMGNKAYYFLGALPSKNKITELIEQIANCSPIKIEVR